MISNVAIGMAVGSFLTLLVPPFITDVTGSAARVGIVFALVSLAATVGPWFGGRADRSGRHRRYYLIAILLADADGNAVSGDNDYLMHWREWGPDPRERERRENHGGRGRSAGGRMHFPANEGFITLQVKPGTG